MWAAAAWFPRGWPSTSTTARPFPVSELCPSSQKKTAKCPGHTSIWAVLPETKLADLQRHIQLLVQEYYLTHGSLSLLKVNVLGHLCGKVSEASDSTLGSSSGHDPRILISGWGDQALHRLRAQRGICLSSFFLPLPLPPYALFLNKQIKS